MVDGEDLSEELIDLELDEQQVEEIEELMSLNKSPERIAEMLQIDIEIIEEYIRRKFAPPKEEKPEELEV